MPLVGDHLVGSLGLVASSGLNRAVSHREREREREREKHGKRVGWERGVQNKIY